jgi:DNA mismatch repair ATPase MutS
MKQQGFLPPKVTPARRQYLDFKAQYPQAVLFFRMGDFYECFDDDAHLVSREIDLTLSARQDGIPMAGVPYHAVETYIVWWIRATRWPWWIKLGMRPSTARFPAN